MKTVILGIDFSPASLNAFRYVAGMLQPYGSRLVLVHVYQPQMLEPYVDFGMQTALLQQHTELALHHFEELKSCLPDNHREQLKLEFRLELGTASEVLRNVSQEILPDLLVVGACGGNSLEKKLLGSTATALVQRTDFPLMIIPDQATYDGLERVAYATDYEEDDIRVIDEVLFFAKQNHAKLFCVHIRENASLKEAYQQEFLKRAYYYDLTHNNISFDALAHHDVVEGLKHYAQLGDIDLMVMLTHHRGRIGQLFHRSHCRDLALQTHIPLWVYPMNETTARVTT